MRDQVLLSENINPPVCNVDSNNLEILKNSKRRLELIICFSLFTAIFGAILQTEMLALVGQQGYKKPIQIMYFTHSCFFLLFPTQELLVYLQNRKRYASFMDFVVRRYNGYKATAATVASHNGHMVTNSTKFLTRVACILSLAVNSAGSSWYIAVNLTTPADITAIYNCSTFFAYLFSVILLKEPISFLKSLSVALSIVGVFIIAYMTPSVNNEGITSESRNLGNLIIACGSVLYGLYDVLYKKLACMPTQTAPSKQACFSNLIGSCIGVATMLLMWPVLIFLHLYGIETFAIPSRKTLLYIIISIIGNVTYSGAFLILMALTDPVLGSISTLLGTCCVPFVEYILFGNKITISEMTGGLVIIIAFGLMVYADKL